MAKMVNIVSDTARSCDIDKEERNKFWFEWLAKTIAAKFGKKKRMLSIVKHSIHKVDVKGRTIPTMEKTSRLKCKRILELLVKKIKNKKIKK